MRIATLVLFKQNREPFLRKMPVTSQHLSDIEALHRIHRDAISEAISLVKTLSCKVLLLQEQTADFGAARQYQDSCEHLQLHYSVGHFADVQHTD